MSLSTPRRFEVNLRRTKLIWSLVLFFRVFLPFFFPWWCRLPLHTMESATPNQPPPRDDPPEQVLVRIEQILAAGHLSSSGSSRDNAVLQAPITLCGRVMNCIIWEETLWNLIQEEKIIGVGSFVRLRNVNTAKDCE